jgi:uncharacterized protein (DUF1697 family)
VTRYVAFLRAINVGGRRVKMDALRAEVESLGYEDVATHIASGNVLFTTTAKAADAEAAVERRLGDALGYDVETFVRTAAQVKAVAGRTPFDVADGDTHMVGFLRRKPTAAEKRSVEALSGDVDTFVVVGKELHWRIHGTTVTSKVSAATMARALRQPTTTRNMKMLVKLAATL